MRKYRSDWSPSSPDRTARVEVGQFQPVWSADAIAAPFPVNRKSDDGIMCFQD